MGQGPRWKETEDVALARAVSHVSQDPITGTDQRYKEYWAAIFFAWKKLLPPAMRRVYNTPAARAGNEADDEEEDHSDGKRTITALQRRFSLISVWVHKLQSCFAEVEKRKVTGHPTFNDKVSAAVAIYCGKEVHAAIRQDRETDIADCRTRKRPAKAVTYGVLNEAEIDSLDAADAALYQSRPQGCKAAKRDRAEDIAEARSADQAADEAGQRDAVANRALESLAKSSDNRNALAFFMSPTMQGTPASSMWIAQQVSMYLGAEGAAATGYGSTLAEAAEGRAAVIVAHAAGVATAADVDQAVAVDEGGASRTSTESSAGGDKRRRLSPTLAPPPSPAAVSIDDNVGVVVAGPVAGPPAVAAGPAVVPPHADGAFLSANGQEPAVPVSLAPRGSALSPAMRALPRPGGWWEETRNIPAELMPDVNVFPVMREPARRVPVSPAAAPEISAAGPTPSPEITPAVTDGGIRYLPLPKKVPQDLAPYRALAANSSDSDGEYDESDNEDMKPYILNDSD
ncbi:hypothetical protein I4F81_003265 [Pyropia yezoensis]|uniref:Uncharacterized protein n=1 Tax=Pyropia yezoensis TaxID=2788 RepID=A0ACC3BS50_PYRYE|nr:hypothetical protein I4F81_003265 [Neopyropia yezoensis]